ncbi:polyprenol reductase 2 isoform X5 [Neltuma alba]|uniref:polyprenol reductase 2 isoform X5 n=1 Tax=Neltuma alba TaxID=207710 RepID=UPI0010A31FCD|nr:polyprenol reductase 2-like isoform X5 [Prosopis alba]XP_028775696.1 polyprenol reductase 2-like isoform X5 [Prosopis alba]
MEICIVLLLRLAWIAGTVPIIIASIPTSKLNWFRGALLGFAKRGKIMQSSSQKFTVPQRLFLHFYIVASVWTTFLLVSTSMYAYTMALSIADPYAVSTITSYLTGTSSLQLACISWVISLVCSPLSLCCDCALEVRDFTAKLVIAFIVKDKVHMPETELDYSLILNHLFKLGWLPWFGATIFLWGWIHQYRCHTILGLLRKRSKQIEEYVIPHGDWFELVSSAHYLSEIVIYAGLLVASGGVNLTIWLLFVFVVANLAFAAVETHKWYLKKFEDYPSNRFVIIPFVL